MMAKKTMMLIATGALMALNGPILAGDVAAGKAKSAVCMACHGATGVSAAPMWPNLAGQKEVYLVKQMTAFQSGSRKEPMMDAPMKGLSADDIANIAAFYAAQSCK